MNERPRTTARSQGDDGRYTALEQAALLETDRAARVAIKWASTQDAASRVSSAAELILKQNPGWALEGDA